MVGGRDFAGQTGTRRRYDDSEPVSLDMYTTMMASRCESRGHAGKGDREAGEEQERCDSLKHPPCTVIGWAIHPADAASATGAERFLEYTPHCIYLNFADGIWMVD